MVYEYSAEELALLFPSCSALLAGTRSTPNPPVQLASLEDAGSLGERRGAVPPCQSVRPDDSSDRTPLSLEGSCVVSGQAKNRGGADASPSPSPRSGDLSGSEQAFSKHPLPSPGGAT
jgi:hypothetical protein